jgi:hypothetical protein
MFVYFNCTFLAGHRIMQTLTITESAAHNFRQSGTLSQCVYPAEQTWVLGYSVVTRRPLDTRPLVTKSSGEIQPGNVPISRYPDNPVGMLYVIYVRNRNEDIFMRFLRLKSLI